MRNETAVDHEQTVVRPTSEEQANSPAHLLRYYMEAGMDYETWSPKFNMHFGYFRRGMNPFKREPMLEEMNRVVLSALPKEAANSSVLDMGCGLGATAKQAIRSYPHMTLDAVSLVPWQIEQARLRARRELTESQIGRLSFHLCDYRATPFPTGHYVAAYALESSCHAGGSAKADFIEEAARLIKPGGTLVIVDGFLKTSGRPRWYQWVIDTVCHCWAVDRFASLPDFVRALEVHGFEEIDVRDISWRIAPSVLHAPWVIVKYLFQRWRAGNRLGQENWNHLKACALSPVAGIMRKWFGYFLITAKRKA